MFEPACYHENILFTFLHSLEIKEEQEEMFGEKYKKSPNWFISDSQNFQLATLHQ